MAINKAKLSEVKGWEEILSDKMDTLRCLSCHKYFPDECEDCNFVEVFDEVKQFINDLLQQQREEMIEEAREWVSKNYSRSSQPLYAHVDLKELMMFLQSLKK